MITDFDHPLELLHQNQQWDFSKKEETKKIVFDLSYTESSVNDRSHNTGNPKFWKWT